MKRIIIPSAYYIAVICLILYIHAWSPTGLAGLGLDIFAYVLVPIISIALLARSLKEIRPGDKGSHVAAAIHALGLTLVIVAVYMAWTRSQ